MTIYDVTPEIIKRAKKMKTIQNEFTITPSGRIPGRICEEIFQLMYPTAIDVAHEGKDSDFILPEHQLTVDVKGKRRNYIPPRPEWNQDINCKNKGEDKEIPHADIFAVFSIHYALDEVTFDGWETRDGIYQKAKFYRKGDPNPDRPKFKYKKDCWSIILNQLRTPEEFNHVTLTEISESLGVGS